MKKNQFAEVKPSYKRKTLTNIIQIKSSQHVYECVKPFFADIMTHKERFCIVLLTMANEVIGLADENHPRIMAVSTISDGGVSGTVADGKVIFQTALVANASAIILVHNHPSGQLRPSESDRALTRKMVEFGKYIELPILDHLIVTDSGYYSFADEGIL